MIKKLTLIIILISGLIACSQNVYNEKLMKAIANNDIEQVSSILEKQKANIDINHISNSETPLTLALNYSNWSYSIDRIVELLVENGADVNAKNENGETALMIASEKGNLELVMYLVENGADINSEDEDGETALMMALRYDYIEIAKYMAKYLIGKGADINAKDNYGWTSLMHASSNGDLEVVKYLVEKGADISDKDNDGMTSLMHAAYRHNKDVMDLLIKNGADINAKDNDGNTTLIYACSYFLPAVAILDIDIVKFLIRAGANINEVINNDGDTAFLYAIRTYIAAASWWGEEGDTSPNFETIRFLIYNGANINIKNKKGETPLSLAAGFPKLTKLLKDNGANVNIKDKDGETPLSLAAGFPELIELLKDNGAHY